MGRVLQAQNHLCHRCNWGVGGVCLRGATAKTHLAPAQHPNARGCCRLGKHSPPSGSSTGPLFLTGAGASKPIASGKFESTPCPQPGLARPGAADQGQSTTGNQGAPAVRPLQRSAGVPGSAGVAGLAGSAESSYGRKPS